ncbi:MAG: hypothetical protein F6K58_31030 [Symploca sp. SIO2E9]|nr:hypothetical protein [Symploca sp. SIO2E9]
MSEKRVGERLSRRSRRGELKFQPKWSSPLTPHRQIPFNPTHSGARDICLNSTNCCGDKILKNSLSSVIAADSGMEARIISVPQRPNFWM